MRLKKLICFGLSLVMLSTAVACGGSTGAAKTDSAPAEETAEEAAEEEAAGTDETAEAEAPAEEEKAAADEAAEEKTAAEENAPAEKSTPVDTAATAANEIPASDISVTWEDSRLYPTLSLGNYYTITTYGVKGYEDVPFISASAFLHLLLEGKEKISVENGVMKVDMNGSQTVIDPASDTITIDNPSRFRACETVDGGVVDRSEFNVVTPSVKNASTQTDAKPLSVSLGAYHLPVIPYEDDILMPFLALQNVFGSIRMSNCLAYNGKDYFNALEATDFASDQKLHPGAKDSPYVKAVYSGPFSEKTEMTKAYAEYGYYSICLLMDLTFGHKEEKNITPFDDYFTRMNAKEALCSTDITAATTAEAMLFYYLFDSGHDALLGMQTVFGELEEPSASEVGGIADEIKESDAGKEIFEEAEETAKTPEEMQADVIIGALLEKGLKLPEVAPLYIWLTFLSANKPQDYGDRRIDFSGDTAVIYFEQFKDDSTKRMPSYYIDPIREEDEEESSFAFFHKCFEEIGQHEEVKNVVINLSNNGGGSATGLVSILGFLSPDGEVCFTNRDLVSESYREEWYHVDTNLDGVADDADGYCGQYDFFIMCSGSSYSCANALPYFAQKEGLAKVIGTNPGGGDCVVAPFIDAFGRCAVYSGMLKLGTQQGDDAGTFVSDEKATTLDYNMMPTILDVKNVPWFDAEGIADAVHRCKDGETEAVYAQPEGEQTGDIQPDQVISDLLGQLFTAISEIPVEEGEMPAETGEAPAQ